MKKLNILILVLLVSIIGVISGCDTQETNSEQQRIDLYVEVMKSIFQVENGGNEFIAIKLDTLEKLSSEEKKLVLESFKDLSPSVYDFEDVKNDKTKFEFDGENRLGTINGSLLWIELEEYEEKSAKITGTSWFGNLGSVSKEYEVKLKDNRWDLTVISESIS